MKNKEKHQTSRTINRFSFTITNSLQYILLYAFDETHSFTRDIIFIVTKNSRRRHEPYSIIFAGGRVESLGKTTLFSYAYTILHTYKQYTIRTRYKLSLVSRRTYQLNGGGRSYPQVIRSDPLAHLSHTVHPRRFTAVQVIGLSVPRQYPWRPLHRYPGEGLTLPSTHLLLDEPSGSPRTHNMSARIQSRLSPHCFSSCICTRRPSTCIYYCMEALHCSPLAILVWPHSHT